MLAPPLPWVNPRHRDPFEVALGSAGPAAEEGHPEVLASEVWLALVL